MKAKGSRSINNIPNSAVVDSNGIPFQVEIFTEKKEKSQRSEVGGGAWLWWEPCAWHLPSTRWASAAGKCAQYFGEEEEITPVCHIPAAQGSVNDTAPLGRRTDVTVDRPEQSVNTVASGPGALRRGWHTQGMTWADSWANTVWKRSVLLVCSVWSLVPPHASVTWGVWTYDHAFESVRLIHKYLIPHRGFYFSSSRFSNYFLKMNSRKKSAKQEQMQFPSLSEICGSSVAL